MKNTSFEKLKTDPRIKKAKSILIEAIKDYQSTIKKPQKPIPHLKKK